LDVSMSISFRPDQSWTGAGAHASPELTTRLVLQRAASSGIASPHRRHSATVARATSAELDRTSPVPNPAARDRGRGSDPPNQDDGKMQIAIRQRAEHALHAANVDTQRMGAR
jgi:hypothetical protein